MILIEAYFIQFYFLKTLALVIPSRKPRFLLLSEDEIVTPTYENSYSNEANNTLGINH